MPERNGNAYFQVRPSTIQGLGAFATRQIRKSTRIIEYRGERISPEEADRRYDDDADTYVLLFTVDKTTVIDAGVGGNDARYINHSCEPNCQAITESGRVYIEALRTIRPGDELTYDYRLELPDSNQAEAATLYACRCGAPNCRGTMLKPPPRRRQKKKRG